MAIPSFTEYLKSNTINEDMYKGYSPQEQSALYNSYSALSKNPADLASTTAGGYAAQGDLNWTPEGSGNDFWSMKGGGGLALGGLQTGIGLMGTLDAMKTAGLQRKLLGQQYATNDEKMANWRSNTANVKSAFGDGLAASGVKP